MAKKKYISLFVATTMAAGMIIPLAACGDPAPKDPEVTGIEVTTAPTKKNYLIGDLFDPTGMVVSKVFDNETTEAVTDYTYTPDGALTKNDSKIVIAWGDYTVDQKISVTNGIRSIEITTEPTKMEYIAGELFDPTGMTITPVLADGTKEDTVNVEKGVVEYKETALAKTDEHFAMSYGGCDFYLDMTVVCGAFVEAEAGLVMSAGVNIAAGPAKDAIESDLKNEGSKNGDGEYALRGIDEGKQMVDPKDGETRTVSGPRVNIRDYVVTNLDWTETTGGGRNASGSTKQNLIEFERGKHGQMLYSLNADNAGHANIIFKMANPNFDGSSSTGYTAPETKLNTVLKLTVNNQAINIPDSVVIPAVDWTQYKSYNSATGDYTGKACRPTYYWQNVSVEIPINADDNSILVESVHETKEVYVDSISFNADKDGITLVQETQFKPEVVSGQLKVENNKVYMGVVVDAASVGYNVDTVKLVLGLTKIKNVSRSTHDGNVGKSDGEDLWTASVSNGGLGYAQGPKNYTNKTTLPVGAAASVEEITEGKFAGNYVIWYDVTVTDDNYEGGWRFSSFNYGAAYENDSRVANAILKDDENVLAEANGFCYQIYCDTRVEWGVFSWQYTLTLVVQKGSFTGDNACKKVLRKYMPHLASDNDPELIEIHK